MTCSAEECVSSVFYMGPSDAKRILRNKWQRTLDDCATTTLNRNTLSKFRSVIYEFEWYATDETPTPVTNGDVPCQQKMQHRVVDHPPGVHYIPATTLWLIYNRFASLKHRKKTYLVHVYVEFMQPIQRDIICNRYPVEKRKTERRKQEATGSRYIGGNFNRSSQKCSYKHSEIGQWWSMKEFEIQHKKQPGVVRHAYSPFPSRTILCMCVN